MKGKFIGLVEINGFQNFQYSYTCPGCGRSFRSTSPELTDPCWCAKCFRRCPVREQLPVDEQFFETAKSPIIKRSKIRRRWKANECD